MCPQAGFNSSCSAPRHCYRGRGHILPAPQGLWKGWKHVLTAVQSLQKKGSPVSLCARNRNRYEAAEHTEAVALGFSAQSCRVLPCGDRSVPCQRPHVPLVTHGTNVAGLRCSELHPQPALKHHGTASR